MTAISRVASGKPHGSCNLASSPQSFSFVPSSIPPAFPPDPASELWPAEEPNPNLYAWGLTEARCVFAYHHWETSEERYDAFQHLINICMKKRGKAFWNPMPNLRFVGTGKGNSSHRTARQDWENFVPYGTHDHATRGWFKANLPELIEKYSPRHITRRELMELIRMRDRDLLHVCNALVCDLMNDAAKQDRNTLNFAIPNDERLENVESATHIKRASDEPDYCGAIRMLVRDKRLRDALSEPTSRTLELLFRKLDAGVSAKEVIDSIARDVKKSRRTVKRYLAAAHRACVETSASSGKLGGLLGAVVLPHLYGK